MPDWREILDRDGPPAWRAAYRITGNRADADDCLQEAFLDALEAARRGPVRHWRALLVCLASARAVDRLRKRRREPAGEAPDWEAVGGLAAPPSRGAEDAELSERLRAALGRISQKQAKVFCMHCLEELSYQEIARELSLSVGAVGLLLHRARKHLRELMADSLGGPRDPRPGAGGLSTETS